MHEQLKEANRTMTNQEARQIVQNFPNWNMDDQWLSDAEMKELVKVLDNALENIIEIKKHKITLSDLENYMKFEDECVKKNFTLKSLLEAREKQIAKKPTPIDYEKYINITANAKFLRGAFWCPCCKHVINSGAFCQDCGQKIDWSEEDE